MKKAKNRTNCKDAHSKSMSDEDEMRIDYMVTTAIHGLDLLIAQASSAGVGTVAKILHTAKEDLVYWAVEMNFFETDHEKFINRILYNNSMFAAADCIASLEGVKDIKTLQRKLRIDAINDQSISLMDNLQETTPSQLVLEAS